MFKLFILFTALAISASGATVTATIGQSATLLVTASGTAPFTYQWQKDGNTIPGATAAVYSIPKVATTDAGAYTVKVTNAAGSTLSDYAVLSVAAVDSSNTFCRANRSDPLLVLPETFTTVVMASVRDPGGHYDATTGFYTVSEAGDYQIVVRARPDDTSVSSVSWGISADIANGDSVSNLWLATNPRGTTYMRNGGLNVIITTLKVGDKVRVFLYSTQMPLLFDNIDFVIHKL